MEITYTTNTDTKNCDAVDVMRVGSRIRWADQNGNQNSEKCDAISKVVSQSPCKVYINETGQDEKRVIPYVRFAAIDEEYVYISGNKKVWKLKGEIERVRQMNLN